MKVKSNIALLPFILFTGGCAVGYNSTLFMTKSNIGIDVDTKPPTAEIAISRREGVIAPSFEGGQTPPVLALFRARSRGRLMRPVDILSNFFFGVDSTFAGGDAAVRLSKGSANPDSRLCLRKEPDPGETLWIWDRSIPEKGEVKPFFFATDTTLGFKLAWSGTTGVHPDTLRLGFSRKEFAWAPVFLETDPNGCKIPGTNEDGKFAVKMPSFLAVLDSNVQVAGEENTKLIQRFATGKSATNLAEDDTIRAAFELVSYHLSDPTVSCLTKWIKVDMSRRSQEIQNWWNGKQLEGFAVLKIVSKEYKKERDDFLKDKNINCP